VAKYCNHCRRFVKGHSAHYTTEHAGPIPGTKPYAAPGPKQHAVTPPSNPTLQSPTNPPTQPAAALASLPSAPPTIARPSLFRCEIPDYDTPHSPLSHSFDQAPSSYNAFYTCIDDAHPFDDDLGTDHYQEPVVPVADIPQYQEPPHFSPSEWNDIMYPKEGGGHRD